MEDQPEEDVVEVKEEPEEEVSAVDEKGDSPSLVINLYSWATPIVGVVMLLLGLVGGYLVYPQINSAYETPNGEAVPAEVSSVQTEAPQPTVDPATRQQLMDFLVPQVKHFKGEATAPVTLIEFSDFQ